MQNKKLFLSMLITSGIGIIISAYLLYIHYFPLIPDAVFYSLCTAGSTFDCNAVNTSAYAMLFGMPLAGWGVAFYLFFIAVILIYTVKTKHVILEFGMLWLAMFAVLLSVVLGYISFVKIQKFCSFCMVLWLCNIALLTLVLMYIASLYKGLINGINTIHDFTITTLFENSKLRMTIVVIVIAGVVSLLVAWGIDETLQLSYNQKEKQREAKILQEFKKEYTMFEKVAIPVDSTIPVIGKKEYPVHITVFFDFNCGACHRTIAVLSELAKKYEGKVAVYLRHFPLDGTCNRFIQHKKDGASCIASGIAYALYGSSSYHDYIMQLMSYRGKVDAIAIGKVVSDLHKDYADLKKLSNTDTIKKLLKDDITIGGKLGIHATPTIIINKTMLKPGIPPAYILEMAIKIEMGKK